MSQEYWFVPKLYGWGFTPINLPGFLATLIFLVILLGSLYSHGLFELQTQTMDLKQITAMIIDQLIILTVFSLIVAKKTKGQLKWNWGQNNRS